VERPHFILGVAWAKVLKTATAMSVEFHLACHVTFRHDSTRSTRACWAVLFQHGGRRTSYSARLYKFSRFMFRQYFNKLVTNIHIITLYKLHNKLSCESRLSRYSRVECVEPCCSTSSTAKMHGLDKSSVSSRVETWRAKWNFGYSRWKRKALLRWSSVLCVMRLSRSLKKSISSLLMAPHQQYNGARARGHLIESDGMFGWYVLVGQSLASMTMPLLTVFSGVQGHRSRSNECTFETMRKCSFWAIVSTMWDTVKLVTYIWRNWLTVSSLLRKSMAIWTLKWL